MIEIANVLILGIAVGTILYLFNLAPIDGTIKRITQLIVIAIAAIWAIKYLARLVK